MFAPSHQTVGCRYLSIERPFQNISDLSSSRERYKDLGELYSACCSHAVIKSKNEVVLALLRLAAEHKLCGEARVLESPLSTPFSPTTSFSVEGGGDASSPRAEGPLPFLPLCSRHHFTLSFSLSLSLRMCGYFSL